MSDHAFIGNQPQALNLGECSAQELEAKLANVFLVPLYYARYSKIDQSAGGQTLWVRTLAVRAELASIERLAEKMRADAHHRDTENTLDVEGVKNERD